MIRLEKIELDQDIEIVTVLSKDTENNIIDMSYNHPDHNIILNNRKEVCHLLNTDFNHCVVPNQCHTTQFKLVDLSDGSKGMYTKEDAIKETDALITKEKDLWLWSFHADCCPVMLYAKDMHIIASIHSGWKGTVKQIATHVIQYMVEELHCNPDHIYAYIGPTLDQDNFEAMDDIIELMNHMSFDTTAFYKRKDATHYLVNHKGLIKETLLHAGVLEAHIKISNADTYTDDDYFSYRKTKTSSRNVTMIKMK